jgi:ketol-acid reductoisomerase
MKRVLAEIQDGTFARDWILENRVGRPRFNAMKRQNTETQLVKVGQQLRSQMTFLKK